MFYEEKLIDGTLHFRTDANGTWYIKPSLDDAEQSLQAAIDHLDKAEAAKAKAH